MNGWKYYNHAIVPDCAPHEIVDLQELKSGKAWKQGKNRPLFARWTEDWDHENQTEWWYIIKDESFALDQVKSKTKNKIRKGLKNFRCKKIDVEQYAEGIFKVLEAANNTYPDSTKQNLQSEYNLSWVRSLANEKVKVYGAFDDSDELCAYTMIADCGNWYNMVGQKANPEYERLQVNAAVLYSMLEDLAEDIKNGKYICNGARTISHETRFNDYLEEYFAFRKAYCRLRIKYRWYIGWIVKLAYPFRDLLKRLDDNKLFHMLNAVLLMEELSRSR